MKKVKRWMAICMGLLMALWSGMAMGEACPHPEAELTRISLMECEDHHDGHIDVEYVITRCQACGARNIQKMCGALEGHVFHMAQSIHCVQEQIHIYVFICQDCLNISIHMLECDGGDACLSIRAQAGEPADVQYRDSLADCQQEFNDAYILQDWLEKNNK